MTLPTDNRRHHWRASFDATVRLADGRGSHVAHLLDLSLKGALVEVAEDFPLKAGDHGELHLTLSPETAIHMKVSVAHVEGRHVGLHCDNIDLDSITHLRRLVELNSGDPLLLERELHELAVGQ
ncbi:PilZ domain-containing protein [Denitratisoma sp. agr-D3]